MTRDELKDMIGIKQIVYFILILIALAFKPALTLIVLFIWFLIKQASTASKRRNIAEQKLHEAAANNPEFSELCGVKPDYVKAFGASGLAGIYLNVTSYNANEVLKKNWPAIKKAREEYAKTHDINEILPTDDFDTVKRKMKLQKKHI